MPIALLTRTVKWQVAFELLNFTQWGNFLFRATFGQIVWRGFLARAGCRTFAVRSCLLFCSMTRQILPLLLLGSVLIAAPAMAQKKKADDGWGSSDGWGAPAAKPAAKKAAAPKAAVAPTPAPMAAPVAAPAAAPAGGEWGASGGSAGGGAAVGGGAASAPEQPIGASLAPGFSAAPSRRVTTDYRGRPLAPYIRRSVRASDPVPPTPAPAPIVAPEPEPAPVAVEPTPAPKVASAAGASAGTKAGGATATKKAAAPVKKAAAPKKKADDGWGGGGSGW